MLFYAILCVKFDTTSIRTELRSHCSQSGTAGNIGGKRGCMGARRGSRGPWWAPGEGVKDEAPAGGLGGGGGGGGGGTDWPKLFYYRNLCLSLPSKHGIPLSFGVETKIQENSRKSLEKKHARLHKDSWKIVSKKKDFKKILNNLRKIRWNKIAVNNFPNFFYYNYDSSV